MKITIDTKTDSQEEIKKTIKFLESLIDSSNNDDSENKEVSAESFSMFNDNLVENNVSEKDEDLSDAKIEFF